MKYKIMSDTKENADALAMDDCGILENSYEVEAISPIDAVIRASKVASESDEVIAYEDEDDLLIVSAYRQEYGTYEFCVFCDGTEYPFTL